MKYLNEEYKETRFAFLLGVYGLSTTITTEKSYGFVPEGYDPCPGYWNAGLNWHEGAFNPYGWMVEEVISEIKEK